MNKQLNCHFELVFYFLFFSFFSLQARHNSSIYNEASSRFLLIDTIPNQGNGIYINNSSNNIIGIIDSKVSNTILGNNHGIYIHGDGNKIFNNYIGTDTLYKDNLGNTSTGIFITGVNNQIGGVTLDSMNIIASNGLNGIEIEGIHSSGNVITGNAIGTNADGQKELGNKGIGINIINAKNNIIGSLEAFGGNKIAFNNGTGIAIIGNLSINIPVINNQLYANGGLGIDLNHDAVTYNDLNDVDIGPNGLLNFPEVLDLYYDSEVLAYSFSIDVPIGDYYISFYNNKTLDPSGYGEGTSFLGAVTISHNKNGGQGYSGSFFPFFPPENNDNITLTATQLINNKFQSTSEFSAYKPIISSCENIFNPGEISGNDINCGTYIPTPIISLIQARGGSGGPIEYKWQKKLDNKTWVDLPNTNTISFTPKSVKETTVFRRGARRIDCTGAWIYSNKISKEIARKISNAGKINGDESNNNPFDPLEINNVESASGGIGQIEYQWYKKTENSNWLAIEGEKKLSYDPPFITETTYYKREAYTFSCDFTSCCGGSPFLYSNFITKRVYPFLENGEKVFFSLKGINKYDNLNTIIFTYLKFLKEKSKTEILLKAEDSSNENTNNFIRYKWEASKNGKDWMEIYGATEKNYALNPIEETPFYRRKMHYRNSSNWFYSNVIKLPLNLIQKKKENTFISQAKKNQQPNKKILLALNIFLEGALENNHLMRDDIRTKELLPLKTPYDSVPNHEFSKYLNNAVLQKSGKNAIVDWLLIELYASNSIKKIPIITKSALIQRDGDIVDYDGISPVNIGNIPEDNYWILLRHRNHQPVISNRLIPLRKGIINAFVDFCDIADSTKKVTMMKSNIHLDNDFFSLKNQRKVGYDVFDYNMNGVLITKGPNNEYSSFLNKNKFKF